MTDGINPIIEKMFALDVRYNPKYAINDIGVSRLFYEIFKDTICYVPESKTWYIYDGKRWIKDDSQYIVELSKDFAEAFNKYANTLNGDIEYILKFGSQLYSRKKRDTIVRDACSIAPRSLSNFDKDKTLLNCQNGTYNLKTMELQPHNPKDFLTKISNAEYFENARCSRWDRFINEVMENDVDTAKFLQKSFSYCLSGEINLECFFILYGNTTRNGKSTACETVSHLLGEYARTVQPETLAKRSTDGSSPSPDIARLKGARFLNMPEPEKGLELNAALIKQLTGGDKFTGRFLHENSFEFVPEFKIFINTNHLPRTGDDTLFSSDRVKLIPFERYFKPEEQDTGLKSHFREAENLSGIFNWLLEGYKLLQEEGLEVPLKVQNATKEYRQDSDIIGTFLNETLMISNGTYVSVSELYGKYKLWANDNGYRPQSIKNFSSEMSNRYHVRRIGSRGKEIENVDYIPEDMPWK